MNVSQTVNPSNPGDPNYFRKALPFSKSRFNIGYYSRVEPRILVPYSDPVLNREYQRAWARRYREVQKEYRRKLRQRVVAKMGGECVNCGCDVLAALEIKYKNSGGRKEYGGSGAGDYQKHLLFAIMNGTRSTDDLELRCKICNALHYVKMIKKIQGKWEVVWTP